MSPASDLEQIKQMLSAGQLTVPDPATGYHRALYARCPRDRHDSAVYRIDRSAESITKVVFRCPICSRQFETIPEKMFLR
jgi:hypothetical protein